MESDDQSLLRLVDQHRRHIYVCGHVITLCTLAIIFACASTIDSPEVSKISLETRPYPLGGVNPRPPQIFEAEDGTPLLVDKDRTLWMAGWNARFFQYYADVPPIISWTTEAEDFVEKEYRRLHFPEDCGSVKGSLHVNVPIPDPSHICARINGSSSKTHLQASW